MMHGQKKHQILNYVVGFRSVTQRLREPLRRSYQYVLLQNF